MPCKKRNGIRFVVIEWVLVFVLCLLPIIGVIIILRMKHASTDMPIGSSLSAYDVIAMKEIALALLFVICLTILLIVGSIRRKKEVVGLWPEADLFVKKHWIVVCCIVLLFLVLIGITGAILLQDLFVFYPNRSEYDEYYLSKRDDYYTISIENGQYCGWCYSKPTNEKALIVFYGNSQNSASFLASMNVLNEFDSIPDYNLYVFDYPGYGNCKGEPSEQSIYEMVNAVRKYLLDNGIENINILGYSIGTGAAVYAASIIPCDKLILLAPYDNMTSIYNSYLPVFYGPLQRCVKHKFPNDKYAADVTCATMIFASKDDEVIPFSSSEKLSSGFKYCTFVECDGLVHNDIIFDEYVWDKISEFLS